MRREKWEALKSMTPAPPGLMAVYCYDEGYSIERHPILYAGIFEKIWYYDEDQSYLDRGRSAR
jgi:hypothetical protein